MPGDRAPTVLVAHPSPDLYGSDRVLLESVTGLVRAGWRVVATVPHDGPLVPELRGRGARVAVCPTPILRRAALRPAGLARLLADSAMGLVAGLRLLRRVRPAAVYVNTVTNPLWFLLARLTRVPAVGHVHEAEAQVGAAQRRVLAAPLRLARTIVANSRTTRRVLAEQSPGLAARTVVVRNAVPGPPEPVPPRERLDPPVRLLYLGRLSPRKGVDLAVSALGLLRERGPVATLDVVGTEFPGYEWYREELYAAAAALGDAVRFHGFVPEPAASYAAADVVLVPSRRDESYGNVAVEAAIAARPVVVAGQAGLREAVEGLGAASVVPPDDAAALADAVARLVADWPRARAAALADAATARERHDPVRYGERIAAILADVAGRAPVAVPDPEAAP